MSAQVVPRFTWAERFSATNCGWPYFGGDSPGDDTHSLIWDAVSSWRAWSNSFSRSL
jgi:hypothetical protein